MFTEDQLLDRALMTEVMTKMAHDLIPDNIKYYLSDEDNRKLMLEQMGDEAFLIPSELKLPLKNPKTNEFDCDMIYCARLITKMRGQNELYEQVTHLFEKCKCQKRIDILVDGHVDTYEFLELLDIMEISFK